MGHILSEPICDKTTTTLETDRFQCATSTMQGWRSDMQDRYSNLLKIHDDYPDIHFFGIYDGHGGSRVAKLAADYLHRSIAEQESFAKENYLKAMEDGFLAFDENLSDEMGIDFQSQGTTATVCIITPKSVYTANVGDSGAIACVKGQLLALTVDHKPEDVNEVARIWAAGGYVSNGRVNGNLAMSRALGDFCYKKNILKEFKDQIVSPLPYVMELEANIADLDFILMASDGIWEVMGMQDVLDFVKEALNRNVPLGEICEALMDRCIASDADESATGCDNMTVTLISFKNARDNSPDM